MRVLIFSIFIAGIILTGCTDDDDRCEDLTCFNGGTCVDGICDCPPGFTGFNCQDIDLCDTLDCLNGGACESGICDCPPGYSGTTCEDFDPCAVISCDNQGTCEDGVCECPPHFTGAFCEDQITPSALMLTAVRITQFPANDEENIPWDPGSLPDLLPEIWKGENVLYQEFNPLINVMPGTIATWQLPTPFSFTDLFDVHNIILYEVDDVNDRREIGRIYFSPYNSNNDFIEIPEISSDSIIVQMQLNYSW